MNVRVSVLVVCVLAWGIGAASAAADAQAAVEPLQLPSVRAGDYAVDVAVSLVPGGREVPSMAADGRVDVDVRLEYLAGAAASFAYNVTDAVAVSLAARVDGVARGEVPAAGALPRSWQWESEGLQPLAGVKWRIRTTTASAPVVGLEFDLAEANVAAVSWTGSVIRDPVVMSASLSVHRPNTSYEGSARARASLGLALAANDKISLRAAVSHSVSLRFDDLPQTSVAIGVNYMWPRRQRGSVGFETSLHRRGPDVRIGFGVSFSLAGSRR